MCFSTINFKNFLSVWIKKMENNNLVRHNFHEKRKVVLVNS